MAQISNVRLPNGKNYTIGDWTTAEPLYSTVEVGPAAFPVLTAFSYSYGGSVPGSVGPRDADIKDTNLEGEGNRLPENEQLIVYNMNIEVFKDGAFSQAGAAAFPEPEDPEVSLPDMLRLQRDLIIRLRIAYVKEYTHSPLSYWPAGTGVSYAMSGGVSRATGGDSGTVRANNGGCSSLDQRNLASPLDVQGGESLSVDVEAGPGQVNGLALDTNSRYRLRIFLGGPRRRPVA